MIKDHKGNVFKTVKEKCEFWKVDAKRYYSRKNHGYTEEQALEWEKFLQAQKDNAKHFADCRILSKQEEQAAIKHAAKNVVKILEEQGEKAFHYGMDLPDYLQHYRGYEEIMFRLKIEIDTEIYMFATLRNGIFKFNGEYTSQISLPTTIKILKAVAAQGNKAKGIMTECSYKFTRAMRDIYAKHPTYDFDDDK